MQWKAVFMEEVVASCRGGEMKPEDYLCKKCNKPIPNDRDSMFCSNECSEGEYDGTTLISEEV